MNHLKRIFLLLITLILNVNLLAQSSEDHGYDAVIDLIVIGSDYGSFTGKPVRDGMELVSLNGHPIPMWIDESSIIRSQVSSNWLRSRLTGYGKYEFLKVGQNSISLKFFLDNGTLTSGTAQVNVYVYPNNNKPKSHLVCSVIVAVGESTGSCSGTYQADLKELSPAKAEKIQEMLSKIKSHSSWFKLLNNSDFHILYRFLIDNQDRDFDDFDLENLKDDPHFQDILTLYNAKMSEVSRLQEGIYAESGKIREELKGNFIKLTEALDQENIDINDTNFFDPDLIPDIKEIASEPGLDGDEPSPLAKMYTNFSSNMIEQFKVSYQNNDRVLLLRQIGSWEKRYLEFDSSLLTSSSPSPQDILALQNSKKMVDSYLYGHLKGYGDDPCIIDLDFWFCDTQVPDDVKELSENNFAHAGVAGENLNSALRTMNPKSFSPEQAQAYFDSLRLLAEIFKDSFSTVKEMSELAKAEQLRIDGMLNDAAHAARNGLKCMSISIATGDFGDLYEAVSGKDICTGEVLSYGERILSVAGIVVLNGRVWRGIGKTLSLSPEVRKLAQSTDELIDSAKKIGFDHADDIKKNVGTIERWKSSFKTSKIDDAQSINKELSEIGYSKPPYTDGTKVVSFKPDTATDFIRVHGDSNQAGRWVMNKNDIQGLSPSQIKEKFALPEVPSKVSDVTVPAWTNMRMGSVAPNYGSTGGGTQFEVLERVDFINLRPLGDL